MITVPVYLLVGQAALLGLACFVLASAYRRLGRPVEATHAHSHDDDEAKALVGTALPDLGPVIGPDGAATAPPRRPGPGPAVLLVYVLPGCETCQGALERLVAVIRAAGKTPDVHVLSVGVDSSIDAYRRFGLPLWRAERNLADIFALKAYPVFLGVDETGMIRAAGSVHEPDALRSYLGLDHPPARPRSPQQVTITGQP